MWNKTSLLVTYVVKDYVKSNIGPRVRFLFHWSSLKPESIPLTGPTAVWLGLSFLKHGCARGNSVFYIHEEVPVRKKPAGWPFSFMASLQPQIKITDIHKSVIPKYQVGLRCLVSFVPPVFAKTQSTSPPDLLSICWHWGGMCFVFNAFQSFGSGAIIGFHSLVPLTAFLNKPLLSSYPFVFCGSRREEVKAGRLKHPCRLKNHLAVYWVQRPHLRG